MCAQVLPGPGLKFLGEQLLGHCPWLRCESVHSQGEHHITCIGSEVEVWTCHSVFFTVLTEEVNQRIERVLVLLQTEYRANRHRPSATSNDAYWHKFPAVFAESMGSVAEKVIKKPRKQVHVVRHPEDVPVTRVVSVRWSKINCKLCIDLLQSWFTVDVLVHEFKNVAQFSSGLRMDCVEVCEEVEKVYTVTFC